MNGAAHRRVFTLLILSVAIGLASPAPAQVFTVGEKSATADINTEFKATHVELPTDPMSERGRRELVRDLESEQGFAHRVLPLGAAVTLQANGNLTPGPEAYKKLLYEKGQSAGVGDRVAITALEFKRDRLIIDLNGGPYPPHRFLSHVQIGMGPAITPDPNVALSKPVSGCRITLVFEGVLPEVSAPEVKALLYPLVDFGVKSSTEAFADTLPASIRSAIASHEVLVGMSRRMVLASMGAPESKVRESDTSGQRYEEWIYGHQPQTVKFVRFVGDRVSLVKIAELGKPIEVRDQDEMAGYEKPKNVIVTTVGDRPDTSSSSGVPTLKSPGEVLPDATQGAPDNGRVQYPVPKSPPAGSTSTPPESAIDPAVR